MKNDDFQIRFKSNMFRGVQLIARQHWLREWLAVGLAKAIIWAKDVLV